MRILSIILFSILLGQAAQAKDDSLVRATLTGRDLLIRQKPGTENLLKEYLRGIPADCNTLYALLYSPTLCTRCEAFIKSFYKILKELSADNRLLIITVYDNAAASERYNKRQGCQADYYIL